MQGYGTDWTMQDLDKLMEDVLLLEPAQEQGNSIEADSALVLASVDTYIVALCYNLKIIRWSSKSN